VLKLRDAFALAGQVPAPGPQREDVRAIHGRQCAAVV
jgi:hypothetical protein